MSKRRSKWREDIKDLIGLLKHEPYSSSDLVGKMKKGNNFSNDALRKRVGRRLDDLKYWGLVMKTKNGKWAWYEHVRTFKSIEEYEMFSKHSKDLIPGVRALIYDLEEKPYYLSGTTTKESFVEDTCRVKLDTGVLDKLEEYFIQHLRVGYANLYNELEKLKNLEKECIKYEKRLKRRIIEELREPAHIPIHISNKTVFKFYKIPCEKVEFSEKGKYRYVDSELIDALITYMTESKYNNKKKFGFKYNKEGESLSWEGHLLAQGVSDDEAKEIERSLRKILRGEKLVKSAEKIKNIEIEINKFRLEIGDKLRGIEAKIRGGDIIEGTCDVCRALKLQES